MRKHERRTFLRGAHPAVRSQLASTVTVSDLLRGTRDSLTLAQRRLLIEQALILLDENYVHLPLKRAMHAVNPVQSLRLLQQRVEQTPKDQPPPDMEFHREMQEIFTSLRDLHTNYMLPAPFADKVAFLPFMVENYYEKKARKYLASHFMQGFSDPKFVPGVEILHWNGVPIDRAVLANGQRFAGSNPAARLARGVQRLTVRPLMTGPPPEEESVVVGFRTRSGAESELRAIWLAFAPEPVPRAGSGVRSLAVGLDVDLNWVHRARKPLFAPKVVQAEIALRTRPRAKTRTRSATQAQATRAGDIGTSLPQILEARKVTARSKEYGYLRIRSFNVDDDAFLKEVIRLLALLPPDGLILDVRENGGGNIYASERLLQLFSPRRIEPEPVQFVNTALNLRMCQRDSDLRKWVPSMKQAVQTGSVFSAAIPLTPVDRCNSHGQVYDGPVVLVTDALCYSATDIFAGGFQDHAIGPILGTDDNTGAGGANVWTHELLSGFFRSPPADRHSPYRKLPNGAQMRVAIRRTVRVGAYSGTLVEDLGITPDQRHYMTRADLLSGNVDLIRRAATLLARMPVRRLSATVARRTPTRLTLELTTRGLSRVDVYADGRPSQTLDVGDGTGRVEIPRSPAGPRTLLIEGFQGSILAAARRISIR